MRTGNGPRQEAPPLAKASALAAAAAGGALATVAFVAPAALADGGRFVRVSDPDAFAARSIARHLPSESDTGRAELTGCRRRISEPDFVQVVCQGRIEVLVFGGQRASKTIHCLHGFKLDPDSGKYLTLREPRCTR